MLGFWLIRMKLHYFPYINTGDRGWVWIGTADIVKQFPFASSPKIGVQMTTRLLQGFLYRFSSRVCILGMLCFWWWKRSFVHSWSGRWGVKSLMPARAPSCHDNSALYRNCSAICPESHVSLSPFSWRGYEKGTNSSNTFEISWTETE